MNYRTLNFESFVTASGEQIGILTKGIYKHNVKSWVLSGMPWDIVRLVLGIPLLILSFVFYLKGSLKAAMIFIGILFSFFYHHSINKRFPVRLAAVFLFVTAGMLFFKCMGEILPMLSDGVLKETYVGYYNLFDQFIDIGIIVPLCIFVGVLLLKRNGYGFLFSTVGLILFLNIGLSVVAGQAILGVMTNTFSNQVPGIAIFSAFMLIDTIILIKIFRNINNKPN